MKDKRIKIELILSDKGYSMSVKVDQEINPIEILGVADLLKSEFPKHVEVDEKLKLSKKLEKDFSEEIEEMSEVEQRVGGREISLDNLPEELQQTLSKVIKEKGIKDVKVLDMTGGKLGEMLQKQQDNCTCFVCRMRKGEKVDLNKLDERDQKHLEILATRERVTVEEMKKKISDMILQVELRKQKDNSAFPMFGHQVGEA